MPTCVKTQEKSEKYLYSQKIYYDCYELFILHMTVVEYAVTVTAQ